MYLIQSNGAYRISSTEHSSRPSDPGQIPQNAQGELLSDDDSNQFPLDALKKTEEPQMGSSNEKEDNIVLFAMDQLAEHSNNPEI